jgi:hypothetical protein
MNPIERSLLNLLDDLIRPGTVRAELDEIVKRAARKLAADRTAVMAWETVPLTVFSADLPPEIRSSWVFMLRAATSTGAERHPNSHQRMMSYLGTGDLQTGGERQWRSHSLISDSQAELERRWISIPPNVWHQAVVPADCDWVVVSFHTAPADELIEERPSADDANPMCQRRYLAT